MTVIPFRSPIALPGFTADDLRTFARWDAGCFRVEIDDEAEAEPLGQFAMIYEGDSCWASWAIARDHGRVALWDCVSLQTLGHFSAVRDALAAIPGAPPQRGWTPVAEIIPFRGLALPPMPVAIAEALTLHQ